MDPIKERTYAEEIAQKSQLPLGWIEDYTAYPNPRLDDLLEEATLPFKQFEVGHLLNGKPCLLNIHLC